MSLRKPPKFTLGGYLANRRNAQKSTGPRKSQRRRPPNPPQDEQDVPAEYPVRHFYAQSLVDAMVALGEDHEEFVRLLARLIRDHQPGSASEMILLEDLATLEWERRRVDRAQSGLLVRQVEQLELERGKRAREINAISSSGSEADLVEKGLRGAPDGPAKFGNLLTHIQVLMDRVKELNFLGDWETIFKRLYGTSPTSRGAYIMSVFNYFVERASSGSPEMNDQDKKMHNILTQLLLEEDRDITSEYMEFLDEHVAITRSMRSALLAPTSPQWGLMIRQKNSIDRNIERKFKLLLHLQKERQLRASAASSNDTARAGAPSKRTHLGGRHSRLLFGQAENLKMFFFGGQSRNVVENKGQPKNGPKSKPEYT